MLWQILWPHGRGIHSPSCQWALRRNRCRVSCSSDPLACHTLHSCRRGGACASSRVGVDERRWVTAGCVRWAGAESPAMRWERIQSQLSRIPQQCASEREHEREGERLRQRPDANVSSQQHWVGWPALPWRVLVGGVGSRGLVLCAIARACAGFHWLRIQTQFHWHCDRCSLPKRISLQFSLTGATGKLRATVNALNPCGPLLPSEGLCEKAHCKCSASEKCWRNTKNKILWSCWNILNIYCTC